VFGAFRGMVMVASGSLDLVFQKPVRFYNVWLEFSVILVNVLITMLDNSLLVSWEG
jgi:hypothetical protein